MPPPAMAMPAVEAPTCTGYVYDADMALKKSYRICGVPIGATALNIKAWYSGIARVPVNQMSMVSTRDGRMIYDTQSVGGLRDQDGHFYVSIGVRNCESISWEAATGEVSAPSMMTRLTSQFAGFAGPTQQPPPSPPPPPAPRPPPPAHPTARGGGPPTPPPHKGAAHPPPHTK